jgi:hypothetical protein
MPLARLRYTPVAESDEQPAAGVDETGALSAVAPVLYGRDDELNAVIECPAPMLLLTGDSGIGKSELLRAAQAATVAVAAPPPRTVRGTSGSLQRALLDCLAEATADVVREKGIAEQVGGRLVEAAKRLAADKGKEAAKVLGRALLLKAKEKVGADAVDLLTDFARELGEVEHETLLARINAATDDDVADILLSLAGEVVDLAGPGATIVLALDAAEALGEEDRRLLGDLATRLPEGLFLRVGFGTYAEEHQAQVENLLAVGEAVSHLELPRLSAAAVRQWLEAEGQDPGHADEVYGATGGYPFDIGDAIQQLAAGQELSDVEPSQQFKMRSIQAWRALDLNSQAVARQLAVFEQPLPEEFLQRACGVSAAEWGATVERLWRSRILSTNVNGVPWFHPKRQQGLLAALGESEREQLEQAAGRAIDAYLEYVKLGTAPQLTADVARLALQSPATLDEDPKARAAAGLNRQQLAVAAAVIDVFEPRSHPPLANAVLEHSREFFTGEGDLVPALARLVELGLVASTGEAQVGGFLGPTFGTQKALAIIQGRALIELGRLPLPGLLSSVFDVALSPRLEPFMTAAYGLGRGTMRGAVEAASMMGMPPAPQLIGRGQGEFLIARARFHERPISATVRFESAELRDSARARIENLRLSVLGGEFEVIDVINHPSEALPVHRFVGAAERALSRQLNRSFAVKLKLESPYDPDTYMDIRVAAFELVHGRCDAIERRMFGLEEPPSLHWYVNESGNVLIEGEAYGVQPRAVRHDEVPNINADDSLTFFRYGEAFGLAEGERLLRLNHRGGNPFSDDPVVQVIGELRDKARNVTRHQSRARIAVDVPTLQARLLAARTRELEDARALAGGVLLNGQQMPEPEARAACVCIHGPVAGAFGRGFAFGFIETTSESGKEEVYVSDRPAPRWGSPEETLDSWGEVFGRKLSGELIRGSNGDATQCLATLLGYHPDDMVLVRADGHPAEGW